MDLNLFRVFDAIYTEGSLTGAGRVLHKTQPAISYSLARLRESLGDALFVRQGNRLVPTPRARQMIDEVRTALGSLDTLRGSASSFDPRQDRTAFRIGMRDVLEATLLPELVAITEDAAPGISLAALRVPRREMAARLASGELDMAIDVRLDVAPSLNHQPLWSDPLVVLGARERHRDMDVDTYLGSRHVLVSSRERGTGFEDFGLRRIGANRRIVLRCQHYFAASCVAARTDLLLTMPRTYATHLARRIDGLAMWPMPVEIPSVDVHLYWHRRVDGDAANAWLRGLIATRSPEVIAG